jgi:hypothetical protein
MPWRGDKLDAETTHVPSYCPEHVGIGFTTVAPAGADLTQLERLSEEPFCVFIENPWRFQHIGTKQEIFPPARTHSIFSRKADQSARAGENTFSAKKACAQVDTNFVRSRNRLRRTHLRAPTTLCRAAIGSDKRHSGKPIGKRRRRSVRVLHGPIFLLPSRPKNIQHAFITPYFIKAIGACDHRSWPQYERLKLLLQSGKSDICWSRSARASPNQL